SRQTLRSDLPRTRWTIDPAKRQGPLRTTVSFLRLLRKYFWSLRAFARLFFVSSWDTIRRTGFDFVPSCLEVDAGRDTDQPGIDELRRFQPLVEARVGRDRGAIESVGALIVLNRVSIQCVVEIERRPQPPPAETERFV